MVMNKQLLEAYAELLADRRQKTQQAIEMAGTDRGDMLLGEAYGIDLAIAALARHASQYDIKLMDKMMLQWLNGEEPTFELAPVEERASL